MLESSKLKFEKYGKYKWHTDETDARQHGCKRIILLTTPQKKAQRYAELL